MQIKMDPIVCETYTDTVVNITAVTPIDRSVPRFA